MLDRNSVFMLDKIHEFRTITSFHEWGNWGLALCSPRIFLMPSFSASFNLPVVLMCSPQAGHFRINMYEPVSAFRVPEDNTHHCRSHLGSASKQSPVALFILHLVHSIRCLDPQPILLLVTHSQSFLFISTAISSGQALILSFLANWSIFTVFSPPWFYRKWMKLALGPDYLYLNPNLGPLSCNWKSWHFPYGIVKGKWEC